VRTLGTGISAPRGSSFGENDRGRMMTADGASLDDCGSKNGTFRGSDRVTAPTPLADGDVIRVGSLAITFHTTGDFGTTADICR
jgi:hypothetical protein